MKSKIKTIEVFQDLSLNFREEYRMEIRQILRSCAKTPWHHAEKIEKEITEDTMVFERESGDDLPNPDLTLWAEPYGYKVVNIVSLEIDNMGMSVYNDVLNDFLNRIVKPASKNADFRIKIKPRMQSITDWTSQKSADALHRFSVLANKSTGSSHSSDQKRWFQFLLSARRTRRRLSPHLLRRWLVEVEGWQSEVAESLVMEYEYGMDLLDHIRRPR